MSWNALSAIGTTVAAFVGVIGIWLNLWDKKKKLNVTFELLPKMRIYISNSSLRSVTITKMVCFAGNYVFYVKNFDGLDELYLYPASVKAIDLITNKIFQEYYSNKMDALCNPNEKIIIVSKKLI